MERLPSGRFRARVIGPEGRYVSAPGTFANRTDASMWVDVQHADLVRGTWQAPVKPSESPSVAAHVARWIEEHPTARDSTKELYRGLLRTCISPTLGRSAVGSLSPAAVRRWHHQLGERLAADAERRQADLRDLGCLIFRKSPKATSLVHVTNRRSCRCDEVALTPDERMVSSARR